MANMVSFFIFALYHRLDTVDGLKCYCNSHRCPDLTCETDGLCYASISIESGEPKKTYHCIEKKTLIPIEHPFTCFNRTITDSFVMECCRSPDMCNKDLPLELPSKPPGRNDVEGELSMLVRKRKRSIVRLGRIERLQNNL